MAQLCSLAKGTEDVPLRGSTPEPAFEDHSIKLVEVAAPQYNKHSKY